MKKILVASDFSHSAGNAMLYALSFAKALKMEITVLNAIHPTEGINNNIYNVVFIEDYYARKRKALQEWTESFIQSEEYKDIPVKTICDVGFLRNVVTKYAEYHEVSFLVMGITGATGIKGIVGSNTSMALSKIRIPTLIVPIESAMPEVPVITLATDYKTTKLSVRDVKALNQILKVSKPKKLEVLHISEKETNPKVIKNGEKKLTAQFPSVEINFNYIDEEGKTSNGIIEFIDNNETDILCLVKRNHNIIYRLFSSSTVEEILNKSVKAILVLHA
ncbi:universal stress protein [Chryseobacterium daecheongense]|nr:universal stress protein [Chryseobacterium daecheongense]